MVDKLEACPFCGGEASLTIPSEHVQADCADIYVSCDECEAEGQHFVVEMQDRTPDLWPYEQRDAIAAWNTRVTPANGEQVERIYVQWSDDGQHIRKWSRTPFDGGSPMNATPTEDARSRVKVLEEALERLERVMRQNIHENDGPDRIMLNGEWHEGPLAAWAIRCFRKVGEIARTALGNKETDRHG